jgi:hypothetical protein
MRHLVGATQSPMTLPTQVASRRYIRLLAHTMQARTEQHPLFMLPPPGHLLVNSPAITSTHESGMAAVGAHVTSA